jgi:hypothetical protein
MRTVLAVATLSAAAVLTLSTAPSAQVARTSLEAREQSTREPDRPSDSMERDFGPGGRIHLDLSAGRYQIVGASDDRLRIEWSVRKRDRLRRVRVRADVRGSDAWVDIDGPDNSGFKVVVRVPRRSDLMVDLSAGEVHVAGVEGNKDIEQNAGEVHVDVGRAEDYRRVHASVWAGEIKASAFTTSKGGLFRTFDWSGRGPYVLTASLLAGELWLYESNDIEAR